MVGWIRLFTGTRGARYVTSHQFTVNQPIISAHRGLKSQVNFSRHTEELRNWTQACTVPPKPVPGLMQWTKELAFHGKHLSKTPKQQVRHPKTWKAPEAPSSNCCISRDSWKNLEKQKLFLLFRNFPALFAWHFHFLVEFSFCFFI